MRGTGVWLLAEFQSRMPCGSSSVLSQDVVVASGAAPGWHCHTGQQARSNPVPQVLLSKGSSILCDGSGSAQGYV